MRGTLAGIAATKDPRAALDDPFLPVRLAGERLAATFGLTAFRTDIRKDLDAPLSFQRDAARDALKQLDGSGR